MNSCCHANSQPDKEISVATVSSHTEDVILVKAFENIDANYTSVDVITSGDVSQ